MTREEMGCGLLLIVAAAIVWALAEGAGAWREEAALRCLAAADSAATMADSLQIVVDRPHCKAVILRKGGT